jgi:hypothetical protein
MRDWDIITYLVFGMGLTFLSLSLYERLKASSPALAQAETAFGLIYAVLVIVVGTLTISNLSTVVKLSGENPAQAATVWLTLDSKEISRAVKTCLSMEHLGLPARLQHSTQSILERQ